MNLIGLVLLLGLIPSLVAWVSSPRRSLDQSSTRLWAQDRREFLVSSATAAVSALPVFLYKPNLASAVLDPRTVRFPPTTYDPEVPFSSVRQYQRLVLPNGLTVLLCSDQRALLSTAALSVGGAGQFADTSLPGVAHLLEHMILSSAPRRADFEDWLSDRDGASNGFTAYDQTCYHFQCPFAYFPEALERFATLFQYGTVDRICRDATTLQREVRRVDSELDFDDTVTQQYYLSKAFVNPEHPFSEFTVGSLETLETIPRGRGIDVGAKLLDFYRQHYQSSHSILVVIGPQDLSALERLVTSFGTALSKSDTDAPRPSYPGGFLAGNRLKQMILYRGESSSSPSSLEKLTFEWSLDLQYPDPSAPKPFVAATQIAFLLSQVLSRRGPGSLYLFLQRRGWVPSGNTGLPKVSVPVDVAGFQILRIELSMTREGLLNRSAIVAAFYDSLATLRKGSTFTIPRELLDQYVAIAKLNSYVLAPRAPDAVELATDAQLYGFETVGTGQFYKFPDDRVALQVLQRTFSSTMGFISDPANALIIATASRSAIGLSGGNRLVDAIPPLSSYRWLREPVSKALFCFDFMLSAPSRVEELVLTRLISEEELNAPVFNPLVPTIVRAARTKSSAMNDLTLRTIFRKPESEKGFGLATRVRTSKTAVYPNWVLLDPIVESPGLPLPRGPPEPTCRCAFVVNLLSSRPARADARQAAQAELWKLSFELAIADLAELGVPGALSYDISFNKFGLRLTFLGISQNLPSYARRFCRRFTSHSYKLLEGPEIFPSSTTSLAVANASKARGFTQQRRRTIISSLRRSTAYESATEGIAFLRSCTGAVCLAEGDLLPEEATELMADISSIMSPVMSAEARNRAATPLVEDLVYRATWKPRSASPCAIPGMILMNDACGRVPR